MLNFFSDEQLAFFNEDGFLFVPANVMWSTEELAQLLQQTVLIETLDDQQLMKYYETIAVLKGENKKIIQRIENFLDIPACAALRGLLNGPEFLALVSQLFNAIQPVRTSALLYKEKINYKLPGGSGYKPHQDVAAGWWQYGQTLHISAYISIDSTSIDNGALELVKGEHTKGLIGEAYQELAKDYCEQQIWHRFETDPGDVLFFTSFVPHRSGINTTNNSRRVVYTTYGMAHQGDFRKQYFVDKRKSFPPDNERLPGYVYEYKI